MAIKSHKKFRIKLAEEFVQPLLNLRSSPECPPCLPDTRGRRQPTAERHLTGKHFAYKADRRGRCAVCSKRTSILKNTVESARCFCAVKPVLRHTTLIPHSRVGVWHRRSLHATYTKGHIWATWYA